MGAYAFNMPGLVWKSVNGERRLVLRWKKRINGKLKIIREIYISDTDRLADMIENPMKDMHVMSLDFDTTAFVRMVDGKECHIHKHNGFGCWQHH